MINRPNIDPSNSNSLAGALKDAFRAWLMEVDDMLPAVIVDYDDVTNRATIKPLVMIGTTEGEKISRAEIPNVPVFRFGGGGFFMRFPIKPGDFGWVKANDRDISLIFQRGGLEDWPNTQRLHSFSDAVFFPDTIKNWAIDGVNLDAFVLQSVDGSVSISLHAGKVVIDAPTVEINGSVAITGGSLTHNGINVGDSHVHGGVEAGSDNTGGPQ